MSKFLKWVKKNVKPTAKLLPSDEEFNFKEDDINVSKNKLRDKLTIGFKFKW
jgi:hypothetical protein